MFKNFLFLSIASLVVLSACSTEEKTSDCSNTLVPIEIDSGYDLSEPKPNEEVNFSTTITHEGLPVETANQVEFEIWEHGNKEYHHLIEAQKAEPGVYQLDWTFEEDGVYYIYYHITACNMHRMEKEMVIVGDVDVDAIISNPDTVNLEIGNKEHNNKKSDHSSH
ncbi:FixH family protein (plasmid) [Alkalihalophilus sp. As8PL]|uniref:FixH family protein n=1 Tax=Alkalihalophilus sp. As8PL TaxID=3237103 RepID=A0AB39BNE4_9BACI